MKCVSRRRAAGAHISMERDARGRELYTPAQARGASSGRRQCHERTGAREGREGGGEGGCGAGVEVIGGDDGELLTTLTLMAVAAGRMVRSLDGRRCTLLVGKATARW